MSSFAIIVHTRGELCSDECVKQVTLCLASLFHAIRGDSSEFIPRIALIRASSASGARYVFSSGMADFNHTTTLMDSWRVGSNTTSSAAESSTAGGGGDVEGEEDEDKDEEDSSLVLANAFRGRSFNHLTAAIRMMDAPHSSKAEGINNIGKEKSNSKDGWRSLASALLMAGCFIERHNATHSLSAKDSGRMASGETASWQEKHGSVIVFTDVEESHKENSNEASTHELSFPTECALSSALVVLLRLGVSLHCFGQTKEHPIPTLPLAAPISRLSALAWSTGGTVAPHFSLLSLGAIIDGDAPTGLAENHSTTVSHALRSESASHRYRRDRMMRMYAICPTSLPANLPSHKAENSERVEATLIKNRKRKRSTIISDERPMSLKNTSSPFAWLCPECMAVVECGNEGGEEREDGCGRKLVLCPYCQLSGSDEDEEEGKEEGTAEEITDVKQTIANVL